MAVDSVLDSVFYSNVEEEEEEEEEDYIDMEVSSFQNLLCHSNANEFEFQMFSTSSDRELTSTSPADELFYKGKLLPLHLPPRLQMVEKILQDKNKDTFDEFFSTPLGTSAYTTPIANTPFGSCNISPSESCQVSRELNPQDYVLDDINTIENPKRSWTKKLILTKQSSFGSKLKASRDYLKSFFGKSSGSDDSRTRISRTSGKKQKEKLDSNNSVHRPHHHRRSFSGAIKIFSTTNTSSGPSSISNSSNSNSSSELAVHHRRINTSSEIENQIQSAIAHCKKSQQHVLHSRNKTIGEMGFCSLTASRIVCDDQERQVLCRG